MSGLTTQGFYLDKKSPDYADKVALIKRMFCKNATDDELEIFIHACNRTRLDPMMKQIYAIKRKQWDSSLGYETDIMTIQTGIDGYRLIAERTGRYMPGRECTYSYDSTGKLVLATAYVKKLAADGSWHEISHTAHLVEYQACKKDGSPVAQWKTKPHIMLAKCAEAACLRKAFPADLSGVYTKEEMEQADNPNIIDSSAEIVSKKQEMPKGQIEVPKEPEKVEFISEEEAEDIMRSLTTINDPAYTQRLIGYLSERIKKPLVDFYSLPKEWYKSCLSSIHRKMLEISRNSELASVEQKAAS